MKIAGSDGAVTISGTLAAGATTITGTLSATGNVAFAGGSIPVASGYQYGIGVGPNGLVGTRSAANDYRLELTTNSKLDGTYTSTTTQPVSVFAMDNGSTSITSYPSGTAGNALGAATASMTLGTTGLAVTGTGSFTNIVNITRTGTTNLQLESPTGGSGISFRLAGVEKWGFGRGITDNSNALQWYDNDAGSTRMTLDSSGNLLVGTTSQIGAEKFGVDSGSGAGVKVKGGSTTTVTLDVWNPAPSGDNIFLAFRTDTSETTRGTITYNRTAGLTSYNTTSDYRLKENIVDLPDALETVSRLKPRQFDWKETGNTTTGFIAHELAEVCPHAVTGEKDATEMRQYEISPAVPATQDEEGNELTAAVEAVMGEREVPRYQGIDTSFLVATLTAAIQEQQAIITALTTRITALEAK
jgi:hypothetical protein